MPSDFFGRLAPHPPRTPEASASRAGRNLAQAIPTAIVLLALVAASVAWRMEIFVAIVGICLAIGLWEAAGAFLVRGVHVPLVPLEVGLIAMVVLTWVAGLAASFVAFLTAAACAFVWRVADPAKRAPADAVTGVFALAWIGVLGCFAVALAGLDQGRWMVAVLVLLPVASDTGGWMAGVLFGKHPMAPSISPKKSWEGFAGSLVLAVIAAWLVLCLGMGARVWVAAVFAVVAVLAGTVGDLSESLLKRDVGVKDMGSLFPGHGGMLDRIDSILMWAPPCYLLAISLL